MGRATPVDVSHNNVVVVPDDWLSHNQISSLVTMWLIQVDDNSLSLSRVVSKLDPEVHDDLIFLLNRKRDEIMNHYASFVSCLCTSVKATGVSVEDFRTFLLKLPAFTNNQQINFSLE